MKNRKIITIQDVSCYGQCSTTVALPILSAFGFETAILPTAILSTHTSGFKNFTVHDLSDELPKIINHWKNENIKYDVLYSAYLGEVRHVDYVLKIKKELLNDKALFLCDPVMGDNGKLYPAFNMEYVDAIRKLASKSDIIIPNLTEATFLAGMEYREDYGESYILSILDKLTSLGIKKIILTGVSYDQNSIGIAIYDDGKYSYYKHRKINKSFHGTGDIYTSVFLAAYLKNNDLYKSVKIAADYVVKCIENTIDDPTHPYGVKYEPLLSKLAEENK